MPCFIWAINTTESIIVSPNACLRKNFWQLKEERNYKPFVVNIVTKLCLPAKMSRDFISWEQKKIKQQGLNVSLVCPPRGWGGGVGTWPVFGYTWPDGRLKPWSCLGQKNHNIDTFPQLNHPVQDKCIKQIKSIIHTQAIPCY